MKRQGPLFALLVLAGCAARSVPSTPAPPQGVTLAFVNVRVFDGEKGIEGGVVLVAGERISAVGPDVAVPAGVTVIDGAGKTLLPGFIDAHSHVHSLAALEQTLAFGVTTTLDMFGNPEGGAELERGITAGHADLFRSGYGATPPGGHGTEYGGPPVPTLTTPGEAAAWVDARIAEGADYIKIIYDDGESYGFAIPTLDEATLAAIVERAHARGKLAIAHIGSLKGARRAIAAGVDGLAHLFIAPAPDAAFGQFAAEHGVFVVPTLAVLRSLCDADHGERLAAEPLVAAGLYPSSVETLSASYPFVGKFGCDAPDATIRQLVAARVPILAGTDAPNPGTTHGATLHEELALLVAAGLTAEQALVAATSAPARAFRLGDRGRIAPGLRADLLLVEGDPTRDILATRAIAGVWKAGHAFDRGAYLTARAADRKQGEEAAAAGSAAFAAGAISDFEDGTTSARFGAGWELSTDSIASGKSVGQMAVVDGGAAGSAKALGITGTIEGSLPYAWAGVMFFPGKRPYAATDLSGKQRLRFWTRGDGATYRLLFFTTTGGQLPAATTFVAPAKWTEVQVELAKVPGLTTGDVIMIMWVGGPRAGPFSFLIDEITLE